MPLDGHVFTGAAGLTGFDANLAISSAIAAAFHAHGYRFCVRYVRRKPKHAYDLTAKEAQAILAANLGLMVVQHVANPGWRCSEQTSPRRTRRTRRTVTAKGRG